MRSNSSGNYVTNELAYGPLKIIVGPPVRLISRLAIGLK